MPIVITGTIEAGAVLLQALLLIPSNSTYFLATGTGENPNIAAMIICMSVPAAVAWIKINEKRSVYVLKGLILLLLVTAILITRCRSAILGLLIVLPFLYIRFKQFILGKRFKLLAAGLSALILVSFLVFNHQKLASTDGRLFIWKLSAQLIAEKPLTGYGYGYFEKAYNQHQAVYFNSEPRSEQEIMTASNTSMAYNDVIEQTIMGGIVGGLLFLACLLLPMWKGWKNRKELAIPLSGVVVFALMSLFNFTLDHPVLFLFFLLYTAVISGYDPVEVTSTVLVTNKINSKERIKASVNSASKSGLTKSSKKSSWKPSWNLALLFLATGLVLTSLPKYSAQRELTRADALLKKGDHAKVGTILRAIEPRVATSEAFYDVKVKYLFSQRDLGGAVLAQQEKLRFTSNPYVLLDMAMLAFLHKEYSLATSSLKTAVGIEPHLFRPKAMLMALYLRMGETSKAKQLATTIIKLKPKIDSPQVQEYKYQAKAIMAGKPVTVTQNLTIHL